MNKFKSCSNARVGVRRWVNLSLLKTYETIARPDSKIRRDLPGTLANSRAGVRNPVTPPLNVLLRPRREKRRTPWGTRWQLGNRSRTSPCRRPSSTGNRNLMLAMQTPIGGRGSWVLNERLSFALVQSHCFLGRSYSTPKTQNKKWSLALFWLVFNEKHFCIYV